VGIPVPILSHPRHVSPMLGVMDEPKKPIRTHLNASERRARKAADAMKFVQQYGRKAQKGVEPNDRRLTKDLTQTVKQMDPMEFDRLLRDDED